MTSWMKWMLPATAALGLVLGLSMLAVGADQKAEDAGKGTIKGTVVDKDGKAVAETEVRVYKPMQRRGGGQGGAQQQAEQPAQGRQRPEPVATGKTDKEGKFEIKDVPVGDYSVSCRIEGQSGRAQVKVEKDKTAEVAIKLAEGGRGGRGGGGGGGGNR